MPIYSKLLIIASALRAGAFLAISSGQGPPDVPRSEESRSFLRARSPHAIEYPEASASEACDSESEACDSESEAARIENIGDTPSSEPLESEADLETSDPEVPARISDREETQRLQSVHTDSESDSEEESDTSSKTSESETSESETSDPEVPARISDREETQNVHTEDTVNLGEGQPGEQESFNVLENEPEEEESDHGNESDHGEKIHVTAATFDGASFAKTFPSASTVKHVRKYLRRELSVPESSIRLLYDNINDTTVRKEKVTNLFKKIGLHVTDWPLECPITQEPMVFPVATVDGHIYDKANIENWFSRNKITSPLTGSALESTATLPLSDVMEAIEANTDENGEIGLAKFYEIADGMLSQDCEQHEEIELANFCKMLSKKFAGIINWHYSIINLDTKRVGNEWGIINWHYSIIDLDRCVTVLFCSAVRVCLFSVSDEWVCVIIINTLRRSLLI